MQNSYISDDFYMYDYKVKRCRKPNSHNRTKCPFSHRNDRAARRDPCRFNYWALPCPEFQVSGTCVRGETCFFAHGMFEQWLHPEKYRTKMCNAGLACQRQVCFFAHTLAELRTLEPHRFNLLFMQQPSLYEFPTRVSGMGLLGAQAVGASSSAVAPPAFPPNALNAFTGGTDFLASLSGVRAKGGDNEASSMF